MEAMERTVEAQSLLAMTRSSVRRREDTVQEASTWSLFLAYSTNSKSKRQGFRSFGCWCMSKVVGLVTRQLTDKKMPCDTNNSPNEKFYESEQSVEALSHLGYYLLRENPRLLQHVLMIRAKGSTFSVFVGYDDASYSRGIDPEIDDDDIQLLDIVEMVGCTVLNVDGKFDFKWRDNLIDLEMEHAKRVENALNEAFYPFNSLVIEQVSKPVGSNEQFDRNMSQMLIDNHVVLSVFQFLDISTVLTCSKVCREWHRMIFYNEQTTNQIYSSRIFSLFKENEWRTANQNFNWMMIYFTSGMMYYELFGEYMKHELDRCSTEDFTFFLNLFQLNALPYLKIKLGEDHMLIKKLSIYQQKTVLFCKNVIQTVCMSVIDHFGSTHLCQIKENDDPIDLLKRVIKTPCITSTYQGLSLDMKVGIPLYFEFLSEMATYLSEFRLPQKISEEQESWIAQCMQGMSEKASYFMNCIYDSTQTFYVDNDILLGLHLILLDNAYHRSISNRCVPIDFIKLLQHRKSSLGNYEQFPNYLQCDFLQRMKMSEAAIMDDDVYMEDFYGAREFITEHVIEMSELFTLNEILKTPKDMDLWIEKNLSEYLVFLNTFSETPFTPKKEVDLFFHLHMLNPNQFVYDSLRIGKQIQGHNFNFKLNEEDD